MTKNINKSIDKGNKRRFWKNGLRFFKHPLGYIFWKGFVHGNSKRLTHFMFIAMLGHSFMLYHLTSGTLLLMNKNGEPLEQNSSSEMVLTLSETEPRDMVCMRTEFLFL